MPETVTFCGDVYETKKTPEKIVVMGVGSCCDFADSLAIVLVEECIRSMPPGLAGKVAVFNTGETPESFTSRVKKEKPTQILIVDTADFGGEPFSFRLIPADKIAGLTLSGHNLPLTMLLKYLSAETGADIFITGVQAPPVADEARVGVEMKARAPVFLKFLESFFD